MTTLQPRLRYTDEELRKLYPAGLDLQLVQVLLRHGERTPVSARFQNAGLRPFWPYCSVVRRLRSTVLEDHDDGKGAGARPPPLSTLEWTRRLETFGPGDEPLVATGPGGEPDGICDMGSLTDVGRASTYQLGRRLRELYVDRLGFLPRTISSADAFYLRTTPVPRALESLQQTFAGLYPAGTRVAGGSEGGEGRGSGTTTTTTTTTTIAFVPPTILTRSPGDETLYPNDGNCRRFAALSRAFAQRAAERWNKTEEMEHLNRVYGRWMPEDSPRVAVDGRPRVTGIMDTVNATLAHGPDTRLPPEFYDAEARRLLEKVASDEWFAGYRESREYRALGIGSLMGDIVGRMVGSAEGSVADGEHELLTRSGRRQAGGGSEGSAGAGPVPIRFGLGGCHDTTLAGVLASLGAFETGEWPPFTSHIAIELFRRSSIPPSPPSPTESRPGGEAAAVGWWGALWSKLSPSRPQQAGAGIGRKVNEELTPVERQKLEGYYVRVRYNDEPVTIPGCKTSGNHLEGDHTFCTLEAFKSIVDKFTPRNWKEECRMNRNAPAFPAKPEPAGY